MPADLPIIQCGDLRPYKPPLRPHRQQLNAPQQHICHLSHLSAPPQQQQHKQSRCRCVCIRFSPHIQISPATPVTRFPVVAAPEHRVRKCWRQLLQIQDATSGGQGASNSVFVMALSHLEGVCGSTESSMGQAQFVQCCCCCQTASLTLHACMLALNADRGPWKWHQDQRREQRGHCQGSGAPP